MTVQALSERRELQEQAEEKQFYLEEFRSRTLLFSLAWSELTDAPRRGFLRQVVAELIANGTRIILCVGVEASDSDRAAAVLASEFIATLAPGDFLPGLGGAPEDYRSMTVVPANAVPGSDFLVRVWLCLRERPLFVALVHSAAAPVTFAEQIAAALRVHKWVIVDPEGGIRDRRGETLSFMDGDLLETLLAEGQAEWAGLGARRRIFASAHRALTGGAGSVNLCDLEGLDRELFTYVGSGTLFTLSDYCAVRRLSIDDYPEVERLLCRGEREGVLKPRSLPEIARILVHGYGATIGGGHLAGFCSLVTEGYEEERAGEVVALYTITRFKGEGIGRKLLARVVADACASGLEYLFACTVVPQAQAFFEREGFRPVSIHEVPAAKWTGYDPQRRERVAVLRKDLPAAL